MKGAILNSLTAEHSEVSENAPAIDLSASSFYNSDIAPTTVAERTWTTKDFAVLWISMSACIPTYQLASSLIVEGMDWFQSIITILLGNLIVLIPMILNAHAGTKYGISFPVYCRASFGIMGANIPAMLRALVACGWFGIQTWIGGWALYKVLSVFMPSIASLQDIAFLGINSAELVCFLVFWSLNMLVITLGIESIRMLLNIKAPLLIVLGLALVVWAYYAANGLGPLFSQPSAFVEGGPKEGRFSFVFFPALTANVGFWATLSLNIPDFSRYARTQKQQVLGQSLGLPTTMLLFSLIGIIVTSATAVVYGETIWDPVEVIGRFQNPIVLIVALISLCIATLATNIAANVVSPANDFAHLWPSKISFKIGGWITGILGVLIQPWRLVDDPTGYIFTWLVAYSALLGSVGGILITDYYLIRKTNLSLPDLYRRGGVYWYRGGYHIAAVVALVVGILPCIPGFYEVCIAATSADKADSIWARIYHYAWFVSFFLSSAVYYLLFRIQSKPATSGL